MKLLSLPALKYLTVLIGQQWIAAVPVTIQEVPLSYLIPNYFFQPYLRFSNSICSLFISSAVRIVCEITVASLGRYTKDQKLKPELHEDIDLYYLINQ